MAPKKASSSGYADGETPVEEEQEVNVQENADVPATPDIDDVMELLASDALLNDMSGSSDDTLTDLVNRFKEMQISIAQKIETVKGEQATRSKLAKAKAKAVAKSMEKTQKEHILEAKKSEVISINVVAPDGRVFRISIPKGKTRGALRTRILKKCQRMGMFNDVSTDGKTKTKNLTRKDIAIVNDQGINLSSKARGVLYNVEGLNENSVVGIMYLNQFTNGNIPQNIQLPQMPEQVEQENDEDAQDDFIEDEDDETDDEDD